MVPDTPPYILVLPKRQTTPVPPSTPTPGPGPACCLLTCPRWGWGWGWGGVGEALRGDREVQSAVAALAELLGQQPRRCSALRSCPSSEPSPEGGRFSTSLAPAQRKRSGSLPGSPDVGGGVEGGGPGGTTALWSASQGLPGLRSGDSSLPCPVPEGQPGPGARSPARPRWVFGPPEKAPPAVCELLGAAGSELLQPAPPRRLV